MNKNKIFIIIFLFVLLLLAIFYYLNERTGISLIVSFQNEFSTNLKEITYQIWQNDSLLISKSLNKNKLSIHLKPGNYDLRVNAADYLPNIFSNIIVKQFQNQKFDLKFFRPPGRSKGDLTESHIDSISEIRKAGKTDIWRRIDNKMTGTPHRIVGSAIKLDYKPQSEQAAKESASRFITSFIIQNNNQTGFSNINPTTIVPETARYFNRKWIVTFKQETKFNNKPIVVYGSQASVIIKGLSVIQFGLDVFPNLEPINKTILSPEDAVAIYLNGNNIENRNQIKLVLFPLPKGNSEFDFIPAYSFNATQRSDNTEFPYETWSIVISAEDGKLLYRERKDIIQQRYQISSDVYPKAPEEGRPINIPIAKAMVGNENIEYRSLDQQGQFSFIGEINRLNLRFNNDNIKVLDSNSNILEDILLRYLSIPPSEIYEIKFNAGEIRPSKNDATRQIHFKSTPEINTFYHINQIRKYFIHRDINSFLSNNIKVAFLDDYPNAYYNGINDLLVFGVVKQSQLGFRSDVIYHEYTHGVVNWLVNYGNDFGPSLLPYKDETGALNEGIADYFACSINNDPLVCVIPSALDSDGKINRNIETDSRYDHEYKTGYDDQGFVHDNSTIISGVFWDVRQSLINKYGQISGIRKADLMIIESLLLKPVPQSFCDFGINMLLANDNDDRLYNGTPDYSEIAAAFRTHGVTLINFEKDKPAFANIRITNNLLYSPNHFEEGGKASLELQIFENGYGIALDSFNVYIEDQQIDRENLRFTRGLQATRVRCNLNDLGPIRRKEFGDFIDVRLYAEDLAGNKTEEVISERIADTIRPDYERPTCIRFENQGNDFCRIRIKVNDIGSGINPKSARLIVNGQQFHNLNYERISDYEYQFNIDLPLDRERWEIEGRISDYAGNELVDNGTGYPDCCTHIVFPSSSIMLAFVSMFAKSRKKRKNNNVAV